MNASENARRIVEGFARSMANILQEVAQKKGWTAQAKAALEARLEELRRAAEAVLHTMRTAREWRWDTVSYGGIGEIKRSNRKNQPVIIRASVVRMEDIACANGQDFSQVVLKDVFSSAEMPSTIIMEPLLGRIQELIHRNAALDFLGFPTLVPTILPGVEKYAFVIADIRAPTSALEIVQASPGEIAAASEHLKELARLGMSPLRWLMDEVARLAGISGLANNPLMAELVEVMVLQALSDGYVRNANGRIHVLLIGPPASGKKLMVSVAEVTNIAFRHAGHKITAAGLVGTTTRENGTFSSKPGLLALAHRGTVAIEDYHSITRSRLADIIGHLAQFMEDGEVHDSTSAKTTFQANTGIHLDLNRARDIFLMPPTGKADVDIPLNIISRCDVVYDLPRDAERQLAAARTMIMDTESVGPNLRNEQDDAIRNVRLIVAALRTDIPVVTVPLAVRQYASFAVDSLWAVLGSHPLLQDYLSMFQTRMVHSLQKIAASHARGHGRSEVETTDVDRAIFFLKRKMTFLRSLVSENSYLFAEGKQGRRSQEAASHFGEEPFSPEEYAEATGVSRPTAYRDVTNMEQSKAVVKVAPGKYRYRKGA